jgi:tRNA nucleotidyltransferase (CCA-adding enzyme)
VLRAAQFAARLGFTVDEKTMELCEKMDISALPRERVFEELKKALLGAEKPSVFFEVLRAVGALDVWFPELSALIGVKQNEKHHSEGDVWVHTMMVIDEAAKRRKNAVNPLAFMLSAVTHDFGKALCTEEIKGEIHAYRHEEAGVPLAEAFMRRLTSEKALIERVALFTFLHMSPNTMAAHGSAIKSTNRLFWDSGEPKDLILLALSDAHGKTAPRPFFDTEPFLWERLAVYEEYMSRPYVSGRDLVEAGFKPDERFKEILTYAHKLRLAGIAKEPALKQVISYAKKIYKNTQNS